MFERSTLAGGPRVISAQLPSRSLSVAYYVLAGSRHEADAEWGVAHFMEHLTFKGTAALPDSRAVADAVEAHGGTCNAATDRESTVYWVRLPLREAERAFDVLAELTVRPLLRARDIERERGIIVEEIRSYRDDPAQYVFNLFDEAFYGGATSLGREIAGSEDSVRALDEPLLRDFWSRAYRPERGVVAVAGDIDHATARDLVARAFLDGSAAGNGEQPPFPTYEPAPALPASRLRVERRSCAQAHICLGLPALPRDHPDQWALELLNAVLGEGSASRLFLNVREAAGLAYDVHSFQSDLADCGSLQVYAGVDPADQAAALEAILVELRRLRDESIPPDELARARAYVSGRLELRLEESRHVCAWLGIQEALHDRVLTLDQALSELAAVTSDQLQSLAQRLIRDEALCMAVITPSRATARLERALRLT
ncbi:MAG TPA: pitrilysin family protein [Candidatus Limnocylindrales bacterium]|jgi:predicted Zn-dependent peptidase|nr:pitrilysin family protein [Candidatus Limnocylindrales bacterium]